MNRAFLVGRLVRDPELKFTPGGEAVTSFTLAIDRNFKNKDGKYDADFINIVVWGKRAENCANYLAKGKQAAVSGRIQTRNYEDKDGRKVYVTEIVADDVQFIDKKDSGASNGASNSGTSGGVSAADDDFFPIDGNDDIPF